MFATEEIKSKKNIRNINQLKYYSNHGNSHFQIRHNPTKLSQLPCFHGRNEYRNHDKVKVYKWQKLCLMIGYETSWLVMY